MSIASTHVVAYWGGRNLELVPMDNKNSLSRVQQAQRIAPVLLGSVDI